VPRHYTKDRFYGAADGIITTLAVVAGGSLSDAAVLRGLRKYRSRWVSDGLWQFPLNPDQRECP
jgi:hypothetical protein